MKTRDKVPAITRSDLAFCLLVEAGATLLEAWDYAPRVQVSQLIAGDLRDIRMDLGMWRRGIYFGTTR